MRDLSVYFRISASRVCLASVLAGLAFPVCADSIRIDRDWFQDVYIVETDQFYQILNPKDGSTQQVSKKRQDISVPQLTKDAAARAQLKADWEKAAKEKSALDARELELRMRQNKISNRLPGDQPRPPRRELTPEERAAERAAWQQKLAERQALAEERQRILDERAGILPEDMPEENPEMDAPAPAENTDNLPPEPPGPRAKPEVPAGPTEEDQARMAQQAQQEEMQRLDMEPYFYNDQERYYYEQQRQQEMERMQAEAYYWQQMEAQGYLDAGDYATPMSGPMQDPSVAVNSHAANGR